LEIHLPTYIFNKSGIKKVAYDPSSRQPELHRVDQTIKTYKHVPQEFDRRLSSAPNPAIYWDDRIADAYPQDASKQTTPS